jgi:hypothetical protein
MIHGPPVLDSSRSSNTTTAGSQSRAATSPILAGSETSADTLPLRTWRARMNPARNPPHAARAITVTASRSTCTSGKRPIIIKRRFTRMMSQRPVTKMNESVL